MVVLFILDWDIKFNVINAQMDYDFHIKIGSGAQSSSSQRLGINNNDLVSTKYSEIYAYFVMYKNMPHASSLHISIRMIIAPS